MKGSEEKVFLGFYYQHNPILNKLNCADKIKIGISGINGEQLLHHHHHQVQQQ